METMKRIFKEWIFPFAIEIVIVLLLIQFAFFLARVPTGSMIPTIQEHSWLFVTRMYAPEKTVTRGDIVVFESDELEKTLIKRVIGLPGEHVALDEGRLYVNGILIPESYVIHTDTQSGEWDVPKNMYLFMGDNRASSWDARLWENPYIPSDKLTGEARFTLWPLVDIGFLKNAS